MSVCERVCVVGLVLYPLANNWQLDDKEYIFGWWLSSYRFYFVQAARTEGIEAYTVLV